MTPGAGASTPIDLDDDARRRADILARLQRQIAWYERVARQNNVGNKACRVVSITAAAVITVLAAAGSDVVLIAALGALIVVAQGVQEVFQFQATWVNFGRTKESLKRELALYQAAAGPYAEIGDPARLLAERTEAVAATELDAWVESQQTEKQR
ncbi:MAG TPA: DUF4231 domain-containing protein [Candidatus Limnocylindrales bacterium]